VEEEIAMNPTWSLALALFALAPQAVNTFSTSFPLERVYAVDLETLHRLHKARPWLDGVSAVAALGLVAGSPSGAVSRPALIAGVGGVVGLQALSHLITAQPAHPAYRGALEVLSREALDGRLAADAPVVGLYLNGEARCYPLALLIKPAVVSDTLGGVPVAPIFCPMSRAALALHDDWQGRRLDLQAVGAPNNDLALYASAPDGVVSQLKGRIMTGPHAGTALPTYPASLTTWGAWRSLHPETTGAWWPTGLKGKYLEKLIFAAMDNDAKSDEPLYATRHIDRRLPIKSPVLAVRVGDEARAFTRETLKARPVIETAVGGEPVVVLYDAARDTAGCFSRRWGGKVLGFEAAGPGVARDRETGRRWDVAGRSDAGERLSPVGLAVDGVHWFAWAYAHPETRVFTAEAASVGFSLNADLISDR
jgi:hypothetical protein